MKVYWEWIYLGSILLVAVRMDLKSERIKNKLICLGIVGIILKVILNFRYQSIIESCLGFTIPIVMLFVLFYFHMLGAGDIKLLAVAGGFLGVKGSLFCMFATFVIGAIFSIWKMCIHQLFKKRFAYFFHYMKTVLVTKKRIPYYDELLKPAERLHLSVPIAFSVALYIGRQMIKGM